MERLRLLETTNSIVMVGKLQGQNHKAGGVTTIRHLKFQLQQV